MLTRVGDFAQHQRMTQLLLDAQTRARETQAQSVLDLVNAALPKVSDYRSELGAAQAALEQINRGHGDAEVCLERQISDIENVDLTEAIPRMSQDQMAVESAMATIARLN